MARKVVAGNPRETRQVQSQQEEINFLWEKLKVKAANRKSQLDNAYLLQTFLADSNLPGHLRLCWSRMSWPGAGEMMERHQELKTDIDTREEKLPLRQVRQNSFVLLMLHLCNRASSFPPSLAVNCRKTPPLHCSQLPLKRRYKSHKNCANRAPPSCGLPQGMIDFYRRQVLEKSHTYDSDTRDQFVIQDLTKEPKNGNFSPVLSQKQINPNSKNYSENKNGRTRQQPCLLYTQTSSFTLEVPHAHLPGVYRSTRSSPSTPPSLIPSSPSDAYSRSPSPCSSHDLSDLPRLIPKGCFRPPPLAQSLLGLLVAQSGEQKSTETDSVNGTSSDR